MPRYTATFTETISYIVEFETPEELDPTDEDGTEAWFEAMDADPQTKDWHLRGEVTDRELDDLIRHADAPAEPQTDPGPA